MRTYLWVTDERGSKRAAIKARPDAREPGPSAAAHRADPSARSHSNEASRPSLLVVALPVLARLAFPAGDGAARDGHPLAPHGVARVLDVEAPSPTPGPAAYQQRAARAHREDRNREPAPGRRPHPGRATRARLRGERGDGEVLSAEGAAASAVPVLANLPRQPPPAAPGCGLLHRADAHLQDAVRLLHHARAPPHRAFQRDGTSDSAVGVASVRTASRRRMTVMGRMTSRYLPRT